MGVFDKYQAALERLDPIKLTGVVERVQGLMVESQGPPAVVGELCQIHLTGQDVTVWAEVVGFKGRLIQLMPYGDMDGIEPGCKVVAMGHSLNIPVSDQLLGRILDGRGRPIDGKGTAAATTWYSLNNDSPDVIFRQTITERLVTGVRSIDALTPVGKGQRIGIFSGSGIGKSTLLGMIARNTSADVNVIALIGERGREVREFIENDLGEEGLARSVLVVSTSDSPPLSRLRGAFVATAIAEYFRDQGRDVMLLFDSITRFARAQREIGLAVGEPPATRGFTPSVFSILPKLLERCGTSDAGTITGFYTILVEGDDMDEPVSDTVRGILDGHIILSRRLAERYHYPAVDVLRSLSRLAQKVTTPQEREAAGAFRTLLAAYEEVADLIDVGAYAPGGNPAADEAVEKIDRMNAFLTQPIEEKAEIGETIVELADITGREIPAFARSEENLPGEGEEESVLDDSDGTETEPGGLE